MIEPRTTGRFAPVTLGTFDGTPSSVDAPSSAKAIASFASDGTPSSSVLRSGGISSSACSIAAFFVPPPLTMTSSARAGRNPYAAVTDRPVMWHATAS